MPFKFVILPAILAVVSAGYLADVPTHYAAAPTVIAKVANPAVDAVALTHQNVVRSFGGTVSQYSKSLHTPYSSVHKEDTRVSNNVYTPTVANATYAAPNAAKSVSYAPASLATIHSAPVVYAHQKPTRAFYTSTVPHRTPHAVKTVSYASAPLDTIHSAPVVYAHQEPTRAVHASTAPHTIYTHEHPTHSVYASPMPTAAVFAHKHEMPSTATTTYNHGPAATTYTHSSPAISAYGSSQTVQYSPADMVSHMSFDGFGTHWNY